MKRRDFLKFLGLAPVAIGVGGQNPFLPAVHELAPKADTTAFEPRILSGISELDQRMGGFFPGDLTIIAGRPSMGKTAVAVQLASFAAFTQKKKVAYFSLEMRRDSLMKRFIVHESKVSLKDLQTGKVADNSWPRISEAARTISDSSLYIVDDSGMTPDKIQKLLKEASKSGGVDMVIVDYFQLLGSDQECRSRTEATNGIIRDLKRIAIEERVPMVVLGQLNRAVDFRHCRRPRMHDLREVSDQSPIDNAILLYRDSYYDNKAISSPLELHIAKSRIGEQSVVTCPWIDI